MTRKGITRRQAPKDRIRRHLVDVDERATRTGVLTFSRHRRAMVRAPPRIRMGEPRAVVITGASRGLGFASTVRLYREGWRVVAAMRTPDRGMRLLREATGAAEDDERLIGVQLDLMDSASISAAAKAIEETVGAPYALVNNAGISAAGMVEETDMELWQNMFTTHVLGPVALTKALLPSMRAAGEGRIVLVSSAGGVRGQPGIAAYSAAKGALERWGESMAGEIAPWARCHHSGDGYVRHRHHHRRRHHGQSRLRGSLRPAARHHEYPRTVRDAFRPSTGAVRRRPGQCARGSGALPSPLRGSGCIDAVGVQQDFAGLRYASHVPAGDGATPSGRTARRCCAVDRRPAGDGVCGPILPPPVLARIASLVMRIFARQASARARE